jgi:hypothetical protein
MLRVVTSPIMLCVVMLSVMAPNLALPSVAAKYLSHQGKTDG